MKTVWHKILALALCLVTAFAVAACVIGSDPVTPPDDGGGNGGGEDTALFKNQLSASSDYGTGALSTAAADDYGNSFTASGSYDSDKYVGIFYCMWQDYGNDGYVPDVTDFQEAGRVENVLTGSEVPSMPAFTWWGKPMYD